MSLTSALYGATTGLSAAQSQMDIISRNVMNVNTEGYTRKTLNQETQVVAGHAYGLFTSTSQRTIDYELQRQYREATATEAEMSVTNSFLSQIQSIFGTPDSGASVAHYVSDLNDAFIEAAATPEDASMLQAVISSASKLAQNFNDMSTQITALRTSANNNIEDLVDQINTEVSQIEALNKQITQSRSSNYSTADLEDKRDALVDKLAEQADITYYTQSDGQLVISMANGYTLLDGKSFKLEYTAQPVSSTTSYPTTIGGITLNGRDITTDITGGELKGYIDLRDTILPQAQAQIDELAGVMISSMAAADMPILIDSANASFSMPGDAVGVAGRITLNADYQSDLWRVREGGSATTESSATGDATLMKAAIDTIFTNQNTFRTTGLGDSGTLSSQLEGSATLEGYAASFIQFQASQKSNSDTDYEFQSTISENLLSTTSGISGVNLDEELSNMIVYQNAYSANARTISTLQEMFDSLLNIL